VHILKGAVFDLDGTLASTAHVHKIAWQESLNKIGINLDIDMESLLGKRAMDIALLLIERSGINDEKQKMAMAKKLLQVKNSIFEPYAKKYAKPMPCSIELIEKLKKNKVKVIVVTSSLRITATKILQTININPDVLVAGDDTDKGKPDPYPVLLALKKASLNTDNIMFAVGDTIYDIMSFGASGIKKIYMTKSDIIVPIDDGILKNYNAIKVDSLCDIISLEKI
jgi:beta-phosphoglucomutase-like phosphatase (HAD superfamily)